MKRFKNHVPLHILEGVATEWRRWFAWRPVWSEQGGWIWLRWTWCRHFTPPIWFTPPAPFGGWFEYSDRRLGWWEETA